MLLQIRILLFRILVRLGLTIYIKYTYRVQNILHKKIIPNIFYNYYCLQFLPLVFEL